MLKNGGVKSNLTIEWNASTVAYLCYSEEEYISCINQHPSLMQDIEKTALDLTSQQIENCFITLVQDYSSKGIQVELGEAENTEYRIREGNIEVTIKRMLRVITDDETKTFTEFKTRINSQAYAIVRAAIELVSQESLRCDSNYLEYQVAYPQVMIHKFLAGEDSKIYRITSQTSNQEMNIAIRGCVNPI
jgi:hypothetical protein